MQFTHELLAQMLAQSNASSSQIDNRNGGKHKPMTLEVDSPSPQHAPKCRRTTQIASEKATDNASEEAIEIASEEEAPDRTPAEPNIVEDDISSVHAGVDELLDNDALDS